jgi:hypothetical protein
MTTATPVAFDRHPPLHLDWPRVTVERRQSAVNAGDGAGVVFEVRYVDSRCSSIADRATHASRAAREAAALVWEREPLAVWLVGSGGEDGRGGGEGESDCGESFYAPVWERLAVAAGWVGAAFVAWTG